MKPLLLIAHPGHELRLHDWVCHTRPHIVVLTHGDGANGQARLADTEALMTPLGVRVRSDWLQPVADGAVYQALLQGDATLPSRWLEGLLQAGLRGEFNAVVADEAEGYNPTHDVCRVLANQLVSRLTEAGHPMPCLEFPLIGHPSDPTRQAQEADRLQLSDSELAHKIEVMRRYAQQCSPVLVQELHTMLTTYGHAAFATECLYTAPRTPYEDQRLPATTPYFELAGEAKARAGVYAQVIRAEHLRRLVQNWLNPH
ncbi:hypothetical protein CCO03_17310 [Comamonas serinivorans]|uniref:GlcNAc-PI de-N-acetylase n=1 Tax=Comamonas serinivorans TaxID=1082851 RepID=A0A1Y0ERR7_9BURK|nr:hypothetical protein [Comamonas serinivorans]ARU06198.1 hypothetical protein CCO03_17310 [Comamonas serinivorans]